MKSSPGFYEFNHVHWFVTVSGDTLMVLMLIVTPDLFVLLFEGQF